MYHMSDVLADNGILKIIGILTVIRALTTKVKRIDV